MILNYYNGDINLEELRKLTKTTKFGTTAYHLSEAALDLGFDAKGIKCEISDLQNLSVPLIAHVTIDETYMHYVVIYEIDFKKKKLLIADPSKKILKMSFSEFEKIWNNVVIALYPVMKLPIKNEKISFLAIVKIFLKHIKKEIIQLFSLTIILTIFTIFFSYYLKMIFDAIDFKDSKILYQLYFIFITVTLLKISIDYFRNRMLIYIKFNLDMHITNGIFKKIIELPYSYYCNRTTGDIVSRLNDLETFKTMITKIFINIIIDIPITIVTFTILFNINKSLAKILIIIVILYVIIYFIFKNRYSENIQRSQRLKSNAMNFMIESISGYESIKGISMEKSIVHKFQNKHFDYIKQNHNLDTLFNYQYVLKSLIDKIGFITLIFIGSLLVVKNEIKINDLIIFNSLLFYFLEPVKNLIETNITINEIVNSVKRILEVVNIKNEEGLIKKVADGDIVISNLTHTYDDKVKNLDKLNLQIKKGEKVLLLGSSGSGKSSLLKILMNYFSIEKGKVFIDGVDLTDYDPSLYRKGIVYISQNEMLFNDTAYNNLNIKEDNYEEISLISKICNVDKIFIQKLGFKTLIEENGANISGGEKQRIVLARALLSNANIILIDEGFSQMDVDLEFKILKQIVELYKNKTIIVVSHRKDNIDMYDKVYYLKKGKIIDGNK